VNAAAIPAALDRFAEIWALDFEYIAPDGESVDPVCCVARELRSGREVRLWDQDLRTSPSPIPVDGLLLSYAAPAELKSMLVLGWPMPAHVLDLYAEFLCFTNGRRDVLGLKKAGLLAALSYFGLSHLDPTTKHDWQQRILQGRPYTDAESAGILDYCATDVVALEHLLPALVTRMQTRPHWLDHALLRGRYMRAVAAMEHRGVPIDAEMLARLSTHWHAIKVELIREICADIPIFEGATLKHGRFARWLDEQGIPWPRTPCGRPATDEDTFKEMVKVYPQVAPIREVMSHLAKLRVSDLAVGRDGRNRAWLGPFVTHTGRNAPKAAEFIFAPSVWLRHLIKPAPGRAIAYIDFSSQEFGIAAALSGDELMQKAYLSGDPYMSFAVEAGLAPPGATKQTHKHVRDRCKALVLGTLYGQKERSLAHKLSALLCEARELLQAHRRTFRTFWAWSQRSTDRAMLFNHLDTIFGWRLHITHNTRATSLLNHPMQAHGAEMLRLACCFLVEAGIELCAPVHDAVLIEACVDEIDLVVVHAQQLMQKAARIVTGGLPIGTDAHVVRWPDRYADERGVEMWARVMALLERTELSNVYREAA